ncbi:hypothetical protein LQE22_004288 [Klebsiella oxytoca]|nr:hypothetical protein [Klebsiella oxytoca]
MTNNQLTDEQIAQLLGDACMVIGDRFATVDELTAAKAIRALAVELQERRKAEKNSEPVVFTDERNLHHIAMGRETSLIWGKQNSEAGDIPLYRHAQPAPTARMVVIPTIRKHYTAAKIAAIYEKAITDAGIEWRSIDD